MKLKKLDVRGFSHDIILLLFVVIFAIGGVAYLVASHADTCPTPTSGVVSTTTSGSTTCPPVSAPVSAPTTLAAGEQLSIPPARRPAQYLHVCVSANITYVAQGTTNCLPGGTFEFNYDPTVPGTLYNVPCLYTSSLLRYVYVSSTENCPATTVQAAQTTGEELSIPPTRRPAQYLHVCNSTGTTYVTQGVPNCLPGGTFEFNYSPTVAGTVYSIPCVSFSSAAPGVRFAYISSGERCPVGSNNVPAQAAAGEQLSIPPARRPAQYLHICSNSGTTNITQGTPNCLPNGLFQGNYSTSVTGTVYSIPCATITGSVLRYTYVSSSEICPGGTFAVGMQH